MRISPPKSLRFSALNPLGNILEPGHDRLHHVFVGIDDVESGPSLPSRACRRQYLSRKAAKRPTISIPPWFSHPYHKAEPMSKKGSILAVGSDRKWLQMLMDVLPHSGYEVRTAENCKAAIAVFAANPADLIVVHTGTTGKGELELCRRIKLSTHEHHTPILAMGDFANILERVDGFRAGAADIIPEPFHREELLARVSTQLELSRLRRLVEKEVDERLALQKAESLAVLAAGIAHDFNNLLGSVLAEADLALSELDPDSNSREHIQNILDIATRASDIVDLLTSYAATGKAPPLAALDLNDVVEEMLRLLRVTLSRRSISIVCNFGEGLPPVRANAPQIRRVIMNLLNNASEALERQEGSITISTSLVHLGAHQGEASANAPAGDYVSLKVADTGVGMTREALAKVLDPFFTTKFLGRGMGLAAVQGIVRSHRGVIRVASTLGSGSVFEVLLPCAAEETVKVQEVDHIQHSLPMHHSTVLLIEDEPALRVAIGKALEKHEFSVISASNGPDAISKLRASLQDIDVALLDLTLPGMSGKEALAAMRKIKPDLKVVLTSAYDQQIFRGREALEVRPQTRFLRKPYRLNELVHVLREEISSPPKSDAPARRQGRPSEH